MSSHSTLIPRPGHLARLRRLLAVNPVVALIGARQVGKTTLAQQVAEAWPDPTHFFDLESQADVARLADPELALAPLEGLVLLDEIQHRPNLFPALRVLADRRDSPARFMVLGSASPRLLQQSSESLAGRVAHYELPGLFLGEADAGNLDRLWLRGGFPRSFAAATETDSVQWRRDFVRTFLERDIPQLGIRLGSSALRRFWSMLAHYHGQVWNGSELARAFGVSNHTVRRYLDLLEATFMVRTLRPWFANLKKRQVKSPRVYIRDSGILHTLLGLSGRVELERHPKIGASWEGFIIESIIETIGVHGDDCHFWATHAGAELDLLIHRGGRMLGFEVKHTAAPRVTRSMRVALTDLGLDRIDVIHAGSETYPLTDGIRAVSAKRLLEDLPSPPA